VNLLETAKLLRINTDEVRKTLNAEQDAKKARVKGVPGEAGMTERGRSLKPTAA
jgi:hypothetical protein